ncbi:hypothetical protein JCM21900_001547 [Sporobolomyces salmonicolor]
MPSFHTDNLTLALASAIVLVLVISFKLRPSPPQAHPFLLGRQSVAAQTRLPDESAVYTNSGSSGARPAIRPEKNVRSLKDVLESSLTCLEGGERGTWIKGGERLADVIKALRTGLLTKLGAGPGKVAVSIEDPTDALLVTLALATSPLKPVVVAPGSALPDAADITAIVHSSTKFVAARGVSANPDATILILGGEGDLAADAQDLLAMGKTLVAGGEAFEAVSAEPSDVALTIISDGIPLELTHLNLTSALVSWLALFPASPQSTKPTIKDTLVSFHHPSTPYGFGLALFGVFTSASLSFPPLPAEPTFEDVEAVFANRSSPSATLVFAPSFLLVQPLYTLILKKMLGDSSFIIRHARDGKLRLLREGSVSKQTIWDSMLFKGIRQDLTLHMLRAVFFDGPVEQSKLETFRCALGVPTVSLLSHTFLLAPLSAGNLWDVQRLPPPGTTALTGKEKAHVGPPATNVEIKLRGDEEEIATGRMRGEILLRSPLLPHPNSLPSPLLYIDRLLPQLPPYPGTSASEEDNSSKWLRTGIKAEMGTEGTLWLSL